MSEQFSRLRSLDVAVTGGTVRGSASRGVQVWRGIPYAAPPVGARRFRSPRPVRAWEGVRDGSQFGSIAPQLPVGRVRGGNRTDEDCLTLNVSTPIGHSSAADPLPVMVFIHGGGYSAGSSRDFSGQGEGFVLAGPVVYVSFNYRLGPLGYLDFSRFSSPDRTFESNLGLRDQLAALRWVQENIRAFGGDPGNVTVFGESAGANAVTTLLGTPTAAGLFARAISQSAPPYAVYQPELTAKWAGEFVALLRGQDPAEGERAGVEEAQELLSGASVAELLTASRILQIRTPDADPGTFCLAPVVDGVLIPESPLLATREGRAHKVPLIIGTNEREGSIFRGPIDILPRTPDRLEAVFDRAPAEARQPMREAYEGLPGRRPAADFGGDYGFWYPSTRAADFHSVYAPVYSYRFDFAPRLLKLVGLDATHGVEMFALFGRTGEPLARTMTALGGRDAYRAAGARMRGTWLSFARDGSMPSHWPAYRSEDRLTLLIDVVDSVQSDPGRVRRRAWSKFLPELADATSTDLPGSGAEDVA